jgi:hypothetical protein
MEKGRKKTNGEELRIAIPQSYENTYVALPSNYVQTMSARSSKCSFSCSLVACSGGMLK